MFENIGIFRVATDLMSHATARQSVTALNISNAETPGYTAREMRDFETSYSAPQPLAMNSTRDDHFGSFLTATKSGFDQVDTKTPVDLEQQLLNSAQIEGDHQRALNVYRSTLGILRSSLGKM
ncbi:flagellar basal body protein [Donghicola sp. XS_ASV15]|uniref:flagellar basal body protein n=1 Tax=Donghicola sp. XS_ASV15 TaxID=3241295 RepID=UPI003513441A